MTNPYRYVHALERQRTGRSYGSLLPIAATFAALPFFQPVVLGFLAEGRLAEGVEGVSLRMGFVIAVLMALHTYSDLIRGPDRAVLDPHPVSGRGLLVAIALRTARQRIYQPLSAAILLAPIATGGHWLAFAGGVAVCCGAWLAMLGVGFSVHLGGVWAAHSPSLSRALDAIRGSNPRMQAALIYSPGVAVGLVGVSVALGASGLRAALAGWGPGWLFVLISPVLGGVGWASALALADRFYTRATSVLTEVDAMYASVEESDGATEVYLGWLGRGRPELLRALRQGWRRRRGFAIGPWLAAVAGCLAGWSGAPDAPEQAAAVVLAVALLLGCLPSRMSEADPTWLNEWLGLSAVRVGAARGAVACLYASAATVPTALVVSLRHGLSGLRPLLCAVAIGFGGAILGAALAAKWRGRAIWPYGSVAAFVWLTVVSRGWM